jgi:hypothetical protein
MRRSLFGARDGGGGGRGGGRGWYRINVATAVSSLAAELPPSPTILLPTYVDGASTHTATKDTKTP